MRLNQVLSTLSKLMALIALAIIAGSLLSISLVSADKLTTANQSLASAAAVSSTSTTTADPINQCATNSTRLNEVITRGNLEIERRLNSLSALSSKINAAVKLSSSDKTSLSNEVSSTTAGLNSLKTQLDSETTICAARSDVSSVYSEYRVYALVLPKVELIKVADDQQVTENKLIALVNKLQARLNAMQKSGTNISSLQSQLNTINTTLQSSENISTGMEASVINLEPTSYDANHSVLEGDNSSLKAAHQDILIAYTDAKQLINSIEK